MTLLDGKRTSNEIKEEIKKAVNAMRLRGERVPHLAAVLVGDDGASLTYVGSKVRSCEYVGFNSTLIRLENNISETDLLNQIQKLNSDNNLDGYIVQLPLPKHINKQKQKSEKLAKEIIDGKIKEIHKEDFDKFIKKNYNKDGSIKN